jgi:hypothetical protein
MLEAYGIGKMVLCFPFVNFSKIFLIRITEVESYFLVISGRVVLSSSWDAICEVRIKNSIVLFA